MERYAISTDTASSITNDPNDWSLEHQDPAYILKLLLSIINLSLQTNDLVAQLPKLPYGDVEPAEPVKEDPEAEEKKSPGHNIKNAQGVTYVINGPVNIYNVETINNEKDDHSQHLTIEK